MAGMAALLGVVPPALAQPPTPLWSKTYGDSDGDVGNSVQQTLDGGFIIAGQIGAVIGAIDSGDVWLLRTDADGDTLWTRRYGGPGRDEGNSVLQTADNGYIVAGYTAQIGGFDIDVWLIRTDTNGDTLWTKTYGGTSSDEARFVQQTADDGFIVVGTTRSYGAGGTDVWLIRTDANGDTLWTRTFGGPAIDHGNAVQQTTDGGFIVAGSLFFSAIGAPDLWLIRTDANGDTLWTRTLNGRYFPYSFDIASDVQQIPGGGFIVVGRTNGPPNTTNTDVWLIRTDAGGDTLWTRQFGGTGTEIANSVQQTSDGGFVIAGYSIAPGSSNIDAMLIRTAADGDSLWSITLGGSGNDQATAIRNTANGGFVLTGFAPSPGGESSDVWLARLDEGSTAIGDIPGTAPDRFRLLQNYPNPFNPTTNIGFRISDFGLVKLTIYDLLGREVKILVNESLAPGSYRVEWDGRDEAGQPVSSGVYFYRLQAKNFGQMRKLILLR